MKKIEIEAKIKANTNRIVINSIFLIGLIVFIFYSIIPSYDQYSINKNQLIEQVNIYENIDKNGIEFSKIVPLIKNEKERNKISKIGNTFYEDTFRTGTGIKNANINFKAQTGSYLNFLSVKEKDIDELSLSEKIRNRDKKISEVLPSFQKGLSKDSIVMTELEFVNYIEKLLRQFRLKTSSSIGISSLVSIDKDIKIDIKDKKDILGSQIFYIPLKLNLEGSKLDIAEFLYFIQNIGKVEKIEQNDITFYQDPVLKDKTLDIKKNIYETKLFSIDSITIYDYLGVISSDNGNNVSDRKVIGFLDGIKNSIDKESLYKLDLDLKFYVKGIPLYDFQDYIKNSISLNHKNLLESLQIYIKESSKESLKNGNVKNTLANLKNLEKLLIEIGAKVKNLEKQTEQKNNLEKLYVDASKLEKDIKTYTDIYIKYNTSYIPNKGKLETENKENSSLSEKKEEKVKEELKK